MTTELDRLLDTNKIESVHKHDVPWGCKTVYLRIIIVVIIRENKVVKERVKITVGGDQVEYLGKVTTWTVELNTMKIHLNNVILTPNAKYMTMDSKDFYLNMPMVQKEYAWLKVEYIPKVFMDKHNLWDMVKDGHVYFKTPKGMYGLPQTGRLAHDLLKNWLLFHRYYECAHTRACGNISSIWCASPCGLMTLVWSMWMKGGYISQIIWSIYQVTRITNGVQFLNSSMFSPIKIILLQAIDTGFLVTWPLLTHDNVQNHLKETMATHQSHLRRVW